MIRSLYFTVLVAVAILLFGWTMIGGDIELFVSHLYLNRIHLLTELAFPYFTPANCGGFVLGADAQNLLFSLFAVPALLLKNTYFAVQLTLIALTVFFAIGFVRWSRWFLPDRTPAAMAASLVLVCSGYWMMAMKIGHLHTHGLVFLPWILDRIETMLARQNPTRRERGVDLLVLTPLLFLVVNSGQVWLQISIPLFLGRFVAEFFGLDRRRFVSLAQTLAILGVAGIWALLLAGPRLGGIFYYAIGHFPRQISILGVFGGIRYMILAIFQSFFDARILVEQLSEKHLGGYYEWTAYLGIASLPVLFVGLTQLGRVLKSKAGLGLFLAVLLQMAMLRGPTLISIFQKVIPLYSGISFHFRGIVVVTLFLCILLAFGFEMIWNAKFKYSKFVFVIALVAILADLFQVYYQSGQLAHGPVRAMYSLPFERPASIHGFIDDSTLLARFPGGYLGALSSGLGRRSCYNPPLVGYENEFFHSQVKGGAVEREDGSANGFLNLNDVPLLFSDAGWAGGFQRKTWPLWPTSHLEAAREFLSFHQVVRLPLWLRIVGCFSVFGFLVYVALGYWIWKWRSASSKLK